MGRLHRREQTGVGKVEQAEFLECADVVILFMFYSARCGEIIRSMGRDKFREFVFGAEAIKQ